jgi:hemolysin activation/secretion protein
MRSIVPTLAAAMVALSNAAFAQGASFAAGSISQAPPAPRPSATLPDIRIERRGSVPDSGPRGPTVVVRSLRITGQTRFSESTLVAVAGFRPGMTLTIADLRRMAALISNYYNAHGYLVAQAYVPAQEVADGVLTIAVIEGRYGSVNLDNRSRLRGAVAHDFLRGLHRGDVVARAPLERRLLLLSDIPGVDVGSTLAAGSQVGDSDLNVHLTNAHLISGDVEADNDGNPYTGRYRGGATLNINDPLGIGDLASVRFLTSGSGMQYVRGSYQTLAAQVTIGAAYEAFDYELGPQYGSPRVNGSEQIASLYASYPLVRSYDDTLRATADVDYRTLQNNNATPDVQGNRRAVAGTLGVNGVHRDRLGGGGSNTYALGVTVGDLDIESPLARAADATSARARGAYAILRGSVDRLQNIGGPFQLYAWVRGQAASRNLDIDEKMELGGASAVRAYPEGEAYGDEGVVGTLEARMWLPKPWSRMPGRLQLAVFEDAGYVRFAVRPWAPGPDSATRSGLGVGLTWAKENNFLVRVSYAHRLGTPPATSFPESGGEFRFEVLKFF